MQISWRALLPVQQNIYEYGNYTLSFSSQFISLSPSLRHRCIETDVTKLGAKGGNKFKLIFDYIL